MSLLRTLASLAVALCASCAPLLACGGDDDERDPDAPVQLWSIPSRGLEHEAPVGGQGGSSAPPPFGSDWSPRDPFDPDVRDAGPPMEPDPSLALFDPEEVYIFGTLSEGACYRDAVAPVLAPDEALTGFSCYARESGAFVRPRDGRLIYHDSSPEAFYAFHCDGCVYSGPGIEYPQDPTANDELISAEACEGLPAVSFMMTAAGETLIQCNDQRWFDETGAEVSWLAGMSPLSVGHQGTALIGGGVLDLESGTLAPLVGLEGGVWLTTRAHEDGYWVATGPLDASLSSAELWLVAFDGTATLQGTYPPLPPGQTATYATALDGSGRVYQFARNDSETFRDTIVRRSVDGESQVVYDEADDPTVKLDFSGLFTGP